MTGFWSWWIIALTLLTIVLVVWLLFATRKLQVDSGDNTTGHVYDGIVEEDNPLPSWWFNMFIISIVFGLAYLALYPGLGNFSGALDWTSAKEHDQRLADVKSTLHTSISAFEGQTVSQLAAQPKAVNMGRRLFANNCAVCHGSDAKGGFGFPNLTDAEWQWGSSDSAKLNTILYGRSAAMPAWKTVMSREQIEAVIAYIKYLPESEQAAVTAPQPGQTLFNNYCSSCHNADAGGNPLMGAPSLVDEIWLYGGSDNQLLVTIAGGRNGHMPAHEAMLSESKIKLILAYIQTLSDD